MREYISNKIQLRVVILQIKTQFRIDLQLVLELLVTQLNTNTGFELNGPWPLCQAAIVFECRDVEL